MLLLLLLVHITRALKALPPIVVEIKYHIYPVESPSFNTVPLFTQHLAIILSRWSREEAEKVDVDFSIQKAMKILIQVASKVVRINNTDV